MTAICPKCGRDCRTALALGKHEAKGCEGMEQVVLTPENHNPESLYSFYDPHTGKNEKCPKCNEIFVFHLILDENTWVCLKCGCHFMPKERLNEINEWKLNDAQSRRG